jgi:hypothetical protein
MGSIGARNAGRVFSNEYEPWCICAKLTGAAAVHTDGYTVTDGGEEIASAARSAEGAITITLRHKWVALLGVDVTCSLPDYTWTKTSETVATTKTIVITGRLQSAGASASTDPDSGVIDLRIWLKGNNL